MKKSLLWAAGLTVLLGGGTLASASDDMKAQDQSATISGCVSASADGKTFTLTESNAASMARPKSWTLVATSGVDLSKYANHKVEITGTSDAKRGVTADTPAITDDKTSAAAAAGPRFQVKQVQDISNICS
jgi:hypothetical protein